jgi:hypothetical protein
VAIPPLPRNLRIQNADGSVSADFARWWQLNVVATEAVQVQAQTAASAAAASASQAATAAATATSAGSGFASGGVVNQQFDCTSATRVTIATVPLIGVTAGTLRFDTTALYAVYPSTEMTGLSTFFGDFWITEQLTSGGVINDLYTDTWSGLNAGQGDVSIYIDDQATLDAARPTVGITGNVTYRLQVARASGTNTVTSAFADFRAAQAS